MIWDTAALGGRERYQLLTSLVVPRPIAWVSTRSPEGRRNLAPFSYFGAVAATPFLVSISIGSRAGVEKDTLRNIRQTGAFCVNVVTEPQMAQMNETGGEYGPNVDEFERAGLASADADSVDAPYVADCPAVLECRLFKVVELEGGPNTMVICEVLRLRLSDAVPLAPGPRYADAAALRPDGRLWGDLYAPLGDTPALKRPAV
ncbi:MAG: flavin reductase family protein [Gemmatimonadetes bacterium]|nr:flavin reductase family protein [Gemmatimonadota bacterium]